MSDLVHVTRKGTDSPVGYILANNNGTTTVCWGVSDKKQYTEDIPTEEVVPVDYKIFSPEEVEDRHVKEAASRLKIEGDI